jgi:hypothetical protein
MKKLQQAEETNKQQETREAGDKDQPAEGQEAQNQAQFAPEEGVDLSDKAQAELEAQKEKEAEEAREKEEIEKAEKEKQMEELKALDTKIQDTMSKYGEALKSGDQQKANALLGEFGELMKQRDALMEKIGISGLDTDEGQDTTGGAGSGYTPIYSGGKGPNGGYFDGFGQTGGNNHIIPTPAPGPIPQGKIVPDGSGQDAVNLGKQYLGHNAIDIKGKLPNFTAAGGQTNNCADFVSSLLESTGRVKGHHVNVVEFEKSLVSQGYREVPKGQAQPGDVWISDSRGHTEMCAAPGGTQCIGSNNDRPGHQVISLNSPRGGHWYHLDSPT